MFVRDIMTLRPAWIPHDSKVRYAAELVARSGVGELVVLDEARHFVGVLSETDILRAALPDISEILEGGGSLDDAFRVFLEKGRALSHRPIRTLLTQNAVVLRPDDHVAAAAVIFVEKRLRRLPVVEEGRLVGTISQAALCEAVVGMDATCEELS